MEIGDGEFLVMAEEVFFDCSKRYEIFIEEMLIYSIKGFS